MMDSELAIQRLEKALAEIPELMQTMNPTSEFNQWYRYTRTTITEIFGERSDHIGLFEKPVGGFVDKQSTHSTISELMSQEFLATNQDNIESVNTPYSRALKKATSILESFIQEIVKYGEDASQLLVPSNAPEGGKMNTNKVFVVHGRDEGTKQTVARFLEHINLKPVILGEQPDEGLTIIEKFEKHAQNVGFAVVVLTPDDVGALQGNENNLKPRARQNVILELGYFIGYLSRHKVCALLRGDIEKPSDYHGVIYIQMDDHGGWRQQLTKNLEAADFDANAG